MGGFVDFDGGFFKSEVYTTTLTLNSGTNMSKFITDRKVDVIHDPVADIIFTGLSLNETVIIDDFSVELVKIPVSEIDLTKSCADIYSDLKKQGLNVIHEYFAVLLWHQDKNILNPGESAIVLTGVLEQAMMGKHIFSIARDEECRYCNYLPVDRYSNVISPYPAQWCIAAKKKAK